MRVPTAEWSVGDRSAAERRRLDAAVKADDGFFTTYFVSSYSPYIARWAAQRGLTPNAVTVVSMLLGLLAAGEFALGSRLGLVAGAVLLQAAFVADCVDGQLARYTGTFSDFGAWLDGIFDRGKEYVCYAGLAIGARRGFSDDVWTLAAAALTLQTARHLIDYGWAYSRSDSRSGGPPHRRSPVYWLRRIVVLPIGERFALISLTAALGTPRLTFLALLGWGAAAGLYGVAGKLRRSAAGVGGGPAAGDTTRAYRDDGLLAELLGRTLGRRLPVGALPLALLGAVPLGIAAALAKGASTLPLGLALLWCALVMGAGAGRPHDRPRTWLVPAIVRGTEYAVLLRLAVLSGDPAAPAACYALLGVLAFSHYDLIFRRQQRGAPPPRWLRWAGGGWELRLLAAYSLLLLGWLPTGLLAAAVGLAAGYAGESLASWRAAGPTRRLGRHHDPEDA